MELHFRTRAVAAISGLGDVLSVTVVSDEIVLVSVFSNTTSASQVVAVNVLTASLGGNRSSVVWELPITRPSMKDVPLKNLGVLYFEDKAIIPSSGSLDVLNLTACKINPSNCTLMSRPVGCSLTAPVPVGIEEQMQIAFSCVEEKEGGESRGYVRVVGLVSVFLPVQSLMTASVPLPLSLVAAHATEPLVYVSTGNNLACFNYTASNNQTLETAMWVRNFSGTPIAPAVSSKYSLVVVATGAHLVAFTLYGHVLWEKDVPCANNGVCAVAHLAFDEQLSTLYVTANPGDTYIDSTVVAYDLLTGRFLNSCCQQSTPSLSGNINRGPVLDAWGNLYVSDSHYVRKLSPQLGQEWVSGKEFDCARTSVPVVGRNHLLVMCYDGTLFGYTPAPMPNNDVSLLHLPTWAWITIAAVCVALLLVIALGLGAFPAYLYMRERLRTRRLKADADGYDLLGSRGGGKFPPSPMVDYSSSLSSSNRTYDSKSLMTLASRERWYIPCEQIEIVRKVASGGTGSVYKARFRGISVAVKALSGYIPNVRDEDVDQLDSFFRELRLLSKLRHPNIVLFLGATYAPDSFGFGIVTEFCQRGSLYDVLPRKKLYIGWKLIIKMAVDIASGMNYLHSASPPIYHRDLKSPNLLVTSDFSVHITDFGLSRHVSERRELTFQVGSPMWMAPEMITEQPYTLKADVYSFGIILWEMLTRQRPFEGVSLLSLYQSVVDGLRPEVPDWCPASYSALMRQCWDHNPDKRPSFAEIVEEILPRVCQDDELDNSVLPNEPNAEDAFNASIPDLASM